MLSIDLAAQLKSAGLAWEPAAGDYFVTRLKPTWWLNSGKSKGPNIWLLAAQPTETGYSGWSLVDTEPFSELYSHDGQPQVEYWAFLNEEFTWLPRLDQLVRELSARTAGYKLGFEKVAITAPGLSGYWIAVTIPSRTEKAEKTPSPRVFYASTPEEAAGRALLFILQKISDVKVT